MKGNSDLTLVLKYLPKLGRPDLEKVRQRTVFLLGVAAPKGNHPEQDWLLDGLTSELRRRGLWARTSTIPAKLLPDGFAEKSAVVRVYLLKGLAKPNPRPVERMSLGGLAASA